MKLKTLSDDLLVFVECDLMSDGVREDLFMPSRDRLTENDFKGELIDGLEQVLRNDETLRQLQNQRQQERTTDRMKDDKPLADVLQHLIRSSPNLTALLQLGRRITAPFNTNPAGGDEEKPFKGEVYPSFFKIKNVEYGQIHGEIALSTTVCVFRLKRMYRDDYFSRRIEGGKFSLMYVDKAGKEQKVSTVGPNLRRGAASVMATLPDSAEAGDVIRFTARTKDTRSEFENCADVTVRPWAEHREGGKKPKDQKPPSKSRQRPRTPA